MGDLAFHSVLRDQDIINLTELNMFSDASGNKYGTVTCITNQHAAFSLSVSPGVAPMKPGTTLRPGLSVEVLGVTVREAAKGVVQNSFRTHFTGWTQSLFLTTTYSTHLVLAPRWRTDQG